MSPSKWPVSRKRKFFGGWPEQESCSPGNTDDMPCWQKLRFQNKKLTFGPKYQFFLVKIAGEITVCGFALLPFCPHALALAPVMVLFFIYVLAAIKRRHSLYLFSHFGSCADIVDSPDVTLACTDDNYDLLLWRQTTSLPFLAVIVEALSKHLKTWRCQMPRRHLTTCRSII